MPNQRSDNKSKISGWLQTKSAEAYRKLAKERGITVTDLLEELIAPYVKNDDRTKEKNTKPFITAQELVEHWAMSPITILKLAREGQIPVLRGGGSLRLESKLLSQKPTPVDE